MSSDKPYERPPWPPGYDPAQPRPTVNIPGYDLIEVPPELQTPTGQPDMALIQQMYPGHAHTPLCGSRDRIVVGVDRSEESKAALRWAAWEAHLRHTHLHLVHTYQDESGPEQELAELTELLTDALPQLPVDVESVAVAAGTVETLVAAAHGAALLVVGHRDDTKKSVARRAAGLASCPVSIVHAGDARVGYTPACGASELDTPTERGRIVVAVDDSFSSRDALWFAANEAVFRAQDRGTADAAGPSGARRKRIELVVVHVAPAEGWMGWKSVQETKLVPPTAPAWDLLEYLVSEVFDNPGLVGAPGFGDIDVTTWVQGARRRDEAIHPIPVRRAVFPRKWPLDDFEGDARPEPPNLDPPNLVETLTELAGTADLVVMGALGRRRFRAGRLASLTEDSLQVQGCPLVIVPDTTEDRADGDIRRATIALEQLWTAGHGATLWPRTDMPAPIKQGRLMRPPQ